MSNRWNSPGAVRFGTLLFPPVGLVLLWRSSEFSAARKILGTIGILLFSVIWSALVVLLLMQFCALQVEFRGGTIPRLTFSKTVPDYAALETSRARQRTSSTPVTGTNSKASQSAYWNGFRGPRRDGLYDEQPIRTNWPSKGCARSGASRLAADMRPLRSSMGSRLRSSSGGNGKRLLPTI